MSISSSLPTPFRQVGFWKFILFSVLTLGIYQIFWLKQRRDEFQQLDSNFVLKNSYFYGFAACIVAGIPLIFYFGHSGIVGIVGWIAAVNLSWTMLEYLTSVSAVRGIGGIKLSKLMGFFFSTLYVEYKIGEISRKLAALAVPEMRPSPEGREYIAASGPLAPPTARTQSSETSLEHGKSLITTEDAPERANVGNLHTEYNKRTVSNPAADSSIGLVTLLVPAGATLLIWFWIGEMALIQAPGSTLNGLVLLTLIVTAGLVVVEANQLGMAKDDGRGDRSPLDWALWVGLVWPYGFPAYFKRREAYGQKSLFQAATTIMVAFIVSAVLVGMAINEQIDEVQGQLRQMQWQLQNFQ